MSRHSLAQRSASRIVHAMLTGAAVLLGSLTAPALAQQVTMETLLDRVQIEDLLVRYYYDLTMGRAHEMSEYFAEDALLDVDGTIAHGRAEIEKLYGGGARARDPNDAASQENDTALKYTVNGVKRRHEQTTDC